MFFFIWYFGKNNNWVDDFIFERKLLCVDFRASILGFCKGEPKWRQFRPIDFQKFAVLVSGNKNFILALVWSLWQIFSYEIFVLFFSESFAFREDFFLHFVFVTFLKNLNFFFSCLNFIWELSWKENSLQISRYILLLIKSLKFPVFFLNWKIKKITNFFFNLENQNLTHWQILEFFFHTIFCTTRNFANPHICLLISGWGKSNFGFSHLKNMIKTEITFSPTQYKAISIL